MEKMGKIIMIKNNKGGVGKTFVTSQLAHLGSTLDLKILVVTTDSQNNILNFMGKSNIEFYNGLETWIKKGTGDIVQLRNNLYFIPLMSDYIHPTSGNKKKLNKFFEDQKKIYDYIFIDATPTLSLDEEFLKISDSIIIPTFCDGVSTDSICKLLDKISDKTKIKAVIPNRYSNTKLEKHYNHELREVFELYNITLTPPINQTSYIGEMINKGKTIWEVKTKKVEPIRTVIANIMEGIIYDSIR